MKDILEEIIANKRLEVERLKESVSLESICIQAVQTKRPVISLKHALEGSKSGIIAEFKRKSPSKGWINRDAKPETVVKLYEKGGASAVSVLTDEKFFGGHIDHIKWVRPLINIPILRKDFIIDPYQIAEARVAGADAILLIAAALSVKECKGLALYAKTLGLEVLLEIHSPSELKYIDDNIEIVGVNNRSLGTFITRVETSIEMADVMKDVISNKKILVSESGISKPDTVKMLRKHGYRGFLIGENFMSSENQGVALKEFISEL
jgi:indole-3-glycerol phosphate synthase